jgi:OOP family OmpA-OmpF porin
VNALGRFSKLALAALAVGLWSAPALAQVTPGFALDRFEPSESGSEWFANDTLDLRGKFRPSFGIVADYSYRPYILVNPDGSLYSSVVTDQLFFHVGGSLVLFDRLRLGLTLPVMIVQDGSSTGGLVNGQRIALTDSANGGIGDLRVAADLRLYGRYGDAFTLAVGGRLWFPTGDQSRFLGDGDYRVGPHVSVAGDVAWFGYAASVGIVYRANDERFASHPMGTELDFSGAVGARLLDRKLLVGPEVYGSTIVADGGAFFGGHTTPLGVLGSAHYSVGDFRFGLGAGPGLSHAAGTAAFRGLASAEYAPAVRAPPPPPPPPPPPSDRDGDGIIDSEDACPDVPGIRTNDPRTNGCPSDRDHDGIIDSEDACPDVPGIRTNDPKTNGCPSDRDGDGIIDVEDACPDVPGIRTNDPKTNGCPSDRDSDGIVDTLDACPDEPGPPNADPKKNGCPLARVKDNQIVITEQIKFRFGLAVLDPVSDPILDAVLKVMLSHTEIAKIRIEGHTDSVGGAAYNKKLSDGRAAAVADWLVKHGVARTHLTNVGFGLTKPIDTNETDEGRANNRRVEFHIDGEGAPKP